MTSNPECVVMVESLKHFEDVGYDNLRLLFKQKNQLHHQCVELTNNPNTAALVYQYP